MHNITPLPLSENTCCVLYCAVNKTNGKAYIGITMTSLYRRKISHKHASKTSDNYFYRAIRKHGWDAFVWHILALAKSREELMCTETRFISEMKTNDRNRGYNTTAGGEHPICTEETKRKIGAANSGKPGVLNGFYGKKHSLENRKLWSELRRGKRPDNGFVKHSKNTKLLLSARRIAWLKTPDSKRIMAMANQKRVRLKHNKSGVIFESIKDAAIHFNINHITLAARLRHKRKVTNGPTFSDFVLL